LDIEKENPQPFEALKGRKEVENEE